MKNSLKKTMSYLLKISPIPKEKPAVLLTLLMALLLIMSCGKDDPIKETPIAENPVDEEPTALTIDQLIANAGDIVNYPATSTKSESDVLNETKEDSKNILDGELIEQRWVCTEREVDVLGGSGDFPLYNPSANVIWPGNIIQGNTINDGLPTAITVKRGLGKITYDLKNGNPAATSESIIIDQGTVNQAINDIVSANPAGAEGENALLPASIVLDVRIINSAEQLAFEMGLSVETFAAKVDAKFSYETSTEVNSVLVQIKQSYYTMSFVTPTSSADFFDESVAAEDLSPYISPGNPGAYIKSVTYGRIFYLLYESTSTASTMKASLEGTYNTPTLKANGTASAETSNQLSDVKVKVIAYGGEASDTFETIGAVFTDQVDLKKILEKIGKAGTIQSGKPISYEVYSLKERDQRLASNLATTYTIKECRNLGILPPEGYRPLVGIFEDGIGAACQLEGNTIVLYNKAGDKYAHYNVNSGQAPTVWSVNNLEGLITSNFISSGNVGAAVRWFGGAESAIALFNMTGNEFVYFRYQPANVANPPGGPLGRFDENPDGTIKVFQTSTHYSETIPVQSPFPFANDGIDAAVQQFYTKAQQVNHRYFSNDGKDAADLIFTTNQIISIWGWTESGPLKETDLGQNFPFESVGAATKVEFGPTTADLIYFNGDGDQMMINNSSGLNGPYYVN